MYNIPMNINTNNWFTVEKIDANTFVISEYKHWEETHCYLLIGSISALLIDTGLGVDNIKQLVVTLTDKPIEVVTTHVHWDHIGGHGLFNNISVHEKEKSWLDGGFPLPLQVVKNNLLREPCDFPDNFDVDNYTIHQAAPTRVLHDNDVIDIGGRTIEVIHTPGHSPGHICLYEKDRGYLFTGDLVYKGTLFAFYPTTDPHLFMQSVKKIECLSVKKVLPSHNSLNINPNIITKISNAFDDIKSNDKLQQGSGIFSFQDFSIHI